LEEGEEMKGICEDLVDGSILCLIYRHTLEDAALIVAGTFRTVVYDYGLRMAIVQEPPAQQEQNFPGIIKIKRCYQRREDVFCWFSRYGMRE
jgi:hypothetical protein